MPYRSPIEIIQEILKITEEPTTFLIYRYLHTHSDVTMIS